MLFSKVICDWECPILKSTYQLSVDGNTRMFKFELILTKLKKCIDNYCWFLLHIWQLLYICCLQVDFCSISDNYCILLSQVDFCCLSDNYCILLSSGWFLLYIWQLLYICCLQVDFCCISDNYWLGKEKPCLTYGLRGVCYFFIEVECAAKVILRTIDCVDILKARKCNISLKRGSFCTLNNSSL